MHNNPKYKTPAILYKALIEDTFMGLDDFINLYNAVSYVGSGVVSHDRFTEDDAIYFGLIKKTGNVIETDVFKVMWIRFIIGHKYNQKMCQL